MNQKPVELLQAQIGLYADNQVEHIHPGRTRTLLANIGEVSMHSDEAPDFVTYPRAIAQKGIVDGEFVTLKPKGSPEPLFANDEYVEFYKDASNREISRNLAGMIAGYQELAPTIEGLGIIGLNLEQAKQHPNFDSKKFFLEFLRYVLVL